MRLALTSGWLLRVLGIILVAPPGIALTNQVCAHDAKGAEALNALALYQAGKDTETIPLAGSSPRITPTQEGHHLLESTARMAWLDEECQVQRRRRRV